MGHRADERELDLRKPLLHPPVRVDDAEGVLPGIEAGHLRQQRAVDVDSELVDDVGGILRRQRHVLRRQRIDRGRPDERGGQPGRLRHVFLHVEDRAVVAADRRQQEAENLLVGRREVDVAAPDPLRLGGRKVLDHVRRLRVVDDHEVVGLLELARVQVVVVQVRLALLGRQALRRALKRVVDRLRRREELVGALDDAPFDVEARIAHQGDERVVDLGHPAPEGRRGEMQHALALDLRCQPPDLLHQPARGDRPVVQEGLGADVDELEHGWATNETSGAPG